MHKYDWGWAQCILAPSNLASSLTHAELPVELIREQGVRQLSEVELAQGGHTVDVLQEGGTRQFRNPLTVKLMPEATKSRRRKTWVRTDLLGHTLPAPSLLSTDGCNPLPALGSSKAEPYWSCNTQKQGCPILQRTLRLKWEVPLPIATPGYLTPESDHVPSTKLYHSPGYRSSLENVAKIPGAPTHNCLVVSHCSRVKAQRTLTSFCTSRCPQAP